MARFNNRFNVEFHRFLIALSVLKRNKKTWDRKRWSNKWNREAKKKIFRGVDSLTTNLPSRQLWCHICPFVTEGVLKFNNLNIFFHGPRILSQWGVQVIEPTLTTLHRRHSSQLENVIQDNKAIVLDSNIKLSKESVTYRSHLQYTRHTCFPKRPGKKVAMLLQRFKPCSWTNSRSLLSSSSDHGPLTRPGRRTFCQRCKPEVVKILKWEWAQNENQWLGRLSVNIAQTMEKWQKTYIEHRNDDPGCAK